MKPTKLHPYLLVLLANGEIAQLWVMVDRQPFLKFTGTSSTFISMSALLAVHFVLNLEYAAPIKLAYQFLEQYLLCSDVKVKVAKYKTITKAIIDKLILQ